MLCVIGLAAAFVVAGCDAEAPERERQVVPDSVGGAIPAERLHRRGGAEAEWDYLGPEGPEFWPYLSDAFADCAGLEQSPVDLEGAQPREPLDLRYAYQQGVIRPAEGRHAVIAEVTGGGGLRLDTTYYALQRMIFHTPSEHVVDASWRDGEVQLVHESASGDLVVLGVLLERVKQRGQPSPGVSTLWAHLPGGEQAGESLTGSVRTLLPDSLGYYTYRGSLTRPPCSEDVTWVIYAEPLRLTAEQLRQLERLYPKNVRPLQRVNRRTIYQYRPTTNASDDDSPSR